MWEWETQFHWQIFQYSLVMGLNFRAGANPIQVHTTPFFQCLNATTYLSGLGSTRALCARNFDFDLCTHSFTSYLATWSINILTFMTTIFFLTFNILSQSDKYVKSLQFLNNSGFHTITIPMD